MIQDRMEHVIGEVAEGALEPTVLAYALERQGVAVSLVGGQVTQLTLVEAIEELGTQARQQASYTLRAERWSSARATRNHQLGIELLAARGDIEVRRARVVQLELDLAQAGIARGGLEREVRELRTALGKAHHYINRFAPVVAQLLVWADNTRPPRGRRLRQIRDAVLERAELEASAVTCATPKEGVL